MVTWYLRKTYGDARQLRFPDPRRLPNASEDVVTHRVVRFGMGRSVNAEEGVDKNRIQCFCAIAECEMGHEDMVHIFEEDTAHEADIRLFFCCGDGEGLRHHDGIKVITEDSLRKTLSSSPALKRTRHFEGRHQIGGVIVGVDDWIHHLISIREVDFAFAIMNGVGRYVEFGDPGRLVFTRSVFDRDEGAMVARIFAYADVIDVFPTAETEEVPVHLKKKSLWGSYEFQFRTRALESTE